MYLYKNILLPTDFSLGSEEAFEHAKDIAKSMGAKIHLLHVIQPVVYPTGIELAHESLINLEQDLEKVGQKNIDKVSERLTNLGIDNSTHILLGKPSEQIMEYVNKFDIDLVVIATHGASGLEHFLFGSTTEKVIRKVKCPVLVVHFKNK
jgi:nucleotide-binding universal stress UspA family protein